MSKILCVIFDEGSLRHYSHELAMVSGMTTEVFIRIILDGNQRECNRIWRQSKDFSRVKDNGLGFGDLAARIICIRIPICSL